MNDALDLVWRRAELPNHVLTAAELARWQPAQRDTIIAVGLLRPTSDATALSCEDCGAPHPVEVIRDPRKPHQPYYLCPEIGRIPLASSDLKRWEVDFDRLAALIRDATGLGGKATTVIPARVWLLGRQQQADRYWELFLVRGICWQDGIASLDQCLRLQQSPAPVVLVPWRLPSAKTLGTRSWSIRSLSEVARIEGSKLLIEDHILSAAATALPGSTSSTPHATPTKRSKPGKKKLGPYSDRDNRVFGLVGERNFRERTNDEILRQLTPKLREIWGRKNRPTPDALRSCLNRIRHHHAFPLSEAIRKKAVNE